MMHTFYPEAAFSLVVAGFGLSLLIKGALLLGMAWGGCALLRRQPASLRHGLWSATLAVLLVMPLLTVYLPGWHVDLGPAWPAPDTPRHAVPAPSDDGLATVPPASGQASSLDPPGAATTPDPSQPLPVSADPISADPAYELPASEHRPGGVSDSLVAFLIFLWLGGSVLMLGRIGLHVLRIRRLTRQAHPYGGGMERKQVRRLLREAGVRRSVALLQSERIAMPMTWGLLRPVLLLPEEASAWPDERLRIVLLHELAHIKRCDYLTHILSEVAHACYWPNPLVWVARRRLLAEQEQACDDSVLRTGVPSLTYAEHLLAIARAIQKRGTAHRSALAMARDTELKGRVRAILGTERNRLPLAPKTVTFVALLAAGVSLPIVALNPGPAPEPQAADVGAAEEPHEARQARQPVYQWMEAEDAAVLPPMRLNHDRLASGWQYGWVPDDEGDDGSGALVFEFAVPHEGAYRIWGRVREARGNDNSFYLSVDEQPELVWDTPEARRPNAAWTWDDASARGADDVTVPLLFHLSAGAHTLRLRNREDGTQLDRLLVTDDVSYTPRGLGATPVVPEPVYQWLEAEDGDVQPPMVVQQAAGAAGWRYVWAPPGTDRSDPGEATYRFSVPRTDQYIIWGRVIAPNDEDDSFFVSIDGGVEEIWDVSNEAWSKTWQWDPVNARGGDGADGSSATAARYPARYTLAAGTHELRIRQREDETRLDRLLITNDFSYRPDGPGVIDPGLLPGDVWLEAEQGTLGDAFEVRQDEHAGNEHYVKARGDENYMSDPPEAGHAAYPFTLTEPGTYGLWGRVKMPDRDEDSFWLRVDNGPWILWNGGPRRNSWYWKPVGEQLEDRGFQAALFHLEAGAHTLEIAQREQGAKLDRLVFTNDPAFTP